MESTIGVLLALSKRAFPGASVSDCKNRARMLASGLRHRSIFKTLLASPPGSAAAELLRERPEMAGVLVWPYQCAAWPADVRIERILNHCSVIDSLGRPFKFSVHARIILVELKSHLEGLRIVMDQPLWFMREGQLTLNIVVHSFRAYSLAFSFHKEPDGTLTIIIGSIQGRSSGEPLGLYREITRSLHGFRPRDILVELLKMLARRLGAKSIVAVTDMQRHHRHPYFGFSRFTTNYDAIWEDRGAVRMDDMFYRLSPAGSRRDFSTIKPHKRSLYRRRFELLDQLEVHLLDGLSSAAPVQFPDS